MKSINYKTIFFLVIFLLPHTVYAHGIFKGLNSFYNGILHPFFVAEQLIVVISLGLFLGQQAYEGHRAFLSFVVALIIGLVLSGFGEKLSSIQMLLTPMSINSLISIAFLASILVIFNLKVPLLIGHLLLILGGLFVGLDSSPPEVLIQHQQWLFLLGVCVSIYLFFLYPLALAESFKKVFWQTIVVRVIASWIAASALMVWVITLAK